MTPADIVRMAGAEGVTLSVTDADTLNANPGSRMSANVRQHVRANKWPLMEHLLEQDGERLLAQWFEHEATFSALQHSDMNTAHSLVCCRLDSVRARIAAAVDIQGVPRRAA